MPNPAPALLLVVSLVAAPRASDAAAQQPEPVRANMACVVEELPVNPASKPPLSGWEAVSVIRARDPRAPKRADASAAVLKEVSSARQRVLCGDESGPIVDRVHPSPVAFSWDQRRVAYTAEREGRSWLCFREQSWRVSGDVEYLWVSFDGEHVAWAERRGESRTILVDGAVQVEACKRILTKPTASGPVWAFFAMHSANLVVVVIDGSDKTRVAWKGVLGPPHDDVALESLVFSPDREKVAYAADRVVVALGGSEPRAFAVPAVHPESLVFAPDSGHLACVNASGIHVDGTLIREDRVIRGAHFPSWPPYWRSLLWCAGKDAPAYAFATVGGVSFRNGATTWPTMDHVMPTREGIDREGGRIAVKMQRGGYWGWSVEGATPELFPAIGPIAFGAGEHFVFCVGGEAPKAPGFGSSTLFDDPRPRRGGLQGALDRLDPGGGDLEAPAPAVVLHPLVLDGKLSALPASVDLSAPRFTSDRMRFCYRTARGVRSNRLVVPGVCVVDLTTSPPSHRVWEHPDASAVAAMPAFSENGQHVTYAVALRDGYAVAIDGICTRNRYREISTAPRFAQDDLVEATAIGLHAAGALNLRVALAAAGEPAPTQPPSPPVASGPAESRPAVELYHAIRAKMPAELWAGRGAFTDLEIFKIDEWCSTGLDGKEIAFDARLEAVRIQGRAPAGGFEVEAILSSGRGWNTNRGAINLGLCNVWQDFALLPLIQQGRAPIRWRVRLAEAEVRRLEAFRGQYLPVRARVGRLAGAASYFVAASSALRGYLGDDADTGFLLGLTEINVHIPDADTSGIRDEDVWVRSEQGDGAASSGRVPLTCGLCNGLGRLQRAHGVNVAGMTCPDCGGRGRR